MKMKPRFRVPIAITGLLFLLASCGTYDKILKSNDPDLMYTTAVELFLEKKNDKALTLLRAGDTNITVTLRLDSI